ncbi:CRISPR-associated protein Csb2 [Herbihabitans rhizosphaerae]|uniref:CRISPR-associated protein Csb2 n=1 Tax=Herbihabitans rhizosphaerae TaxID=1872711 RepID=A0A4Q7L642_9PSEU|nr:type I-U CRISPR-associated protein Csb2 [Herbihabitans rhizosphaerae]RZS44716.1 CRISPR-associated protein Csb2 [Herbihabitans rhizosphaerae]
MPTFLVLTFPWGRYHATPWGRHVNEGAVEIPPSPWRLLRALYAVWQTRVPELSEDVVHGLLNELAAPPIFHVPRHELSHTRHYYPDVAHRNGKGSVDRTLDAFAVMARGASLAAEWPFELNDEHAAALSRLASSIPYFGRADSLCTGSAPAQWTPNDHETWVPLDVATTVDQDAETSTVLAAEKPLRLDSLTARPVDIRRGGLLFPSGSRLVGYQRLAPLPAPRPRRAPGRPEPKAIRFTIAQSGLPPETDALVYTDLLRQAALHKLGKARWERQHSMLSGKTAAGEPLTGHRHAHYLPVLTSERRLGGLMVWVPDGLPHDEADALTRVMELNGRTVRRAVRVRVDAVGDSAAGLCRPSREWVSVTPFTPTRYPKAKQSWHEFLNAEIARELSMRNITVEPAVEIIDRDWRAFRRYRPSARLRQNRSHGQANRPSEFLRLRFDEPVAGPVALGHLSHFGLGLFTPAEE